MKTELIDKLRALRAEYGYSAFDHAVKTLMRERLQGERTEKRIRFSKSTYQRLFDKQQGICPWCEHPLAIPARKNHIDHINPNEAEFNSVRNLQLLHSHCNTLKNAKSIQEQSKTTGRPFTELLGEHDDTQ